MSSSNESTEKHRKHMNSYLSSLDEGKNGKRTSKTLSEQKYNQCVQYLQNPSLITDPQFKHWIEKKKEFELISYPDMGLKDVLVVPKSAVKTKKKKGTLELLQYSISY